MSTECSTPGGVVQVNYNRDACQSHARCQLVAPELFDVDDEGYAVLLVQGDLPSELEEQARLAASRCPEFAIETSS